MEAGGRCIPIRPSDSESDFFVFLCRASHYRFLVDALAALFDRQMFIAFRVSCRVDDAKCIVVTAVCVCVSVCLSVPRRMPTLLHGPGWNLGNGRECPVVVHYWADLQSVHHNSAERDMSASACTRSMRGLPFTI